MLEPLGLPFTALYALAAGHAVLPVLDGDPTAGAAAPGGPGRRRALAGRRSGERRDPDQSLDGRERGRACCCWSSSAPIPASAWPGWPCRQRWRTSPGRPGGPRGGSRQRWSARWTRYALELLTTQAIEGRRPAGGSGCGAPTGSNRRPRRFRSSATCSPCFPDPSASDAGSWLQRPAEAVEHHVEPERELGAEVVVGSLVAAATSATGPGSVDRQRRLGQRESRRRSCRAGDPRPPATTRRPCGTRRGWGRCAHAPVQLRDRRQLGVVQGESEHVQVLRDPVRRHPISAGRRGRAAGASG